ncbi:DUF2306 domain-containing protein [Paenibacillus sp. 481]|uniref:DUF2306 domain-containing protein n=1 Tax=Paenibacillus sp. 481 TaxID=2835869 RepID=UPI001E493932|nr:DUF2306 domain-containing protein [Paenibacillus sp. 481]UHA75113.1 DUF2306 domain-containing protein [Paenibacillus sp. 481]
MKKWELGLLLFCSLAIAGYAIAQYTFIDASHNSFLTSKIAIMGQLKSIWYIVLYIHICSSLFPLVLGPFLLYEKWRQRWLRAHRMAGKIYVVSIAFGGISGLYLAMYATGGPVSRLGFAALSIAWMLCTFMAFRRILQKDIQAHRRWMIRSFALTLASVTLRIWIPLFLFVFGGEAFETSYIVIAWLCWVPNLLIAEWYMRRRTPRLPVSLTTGNRISP